ncbi:hypothetical protein [Kocuria kalidii]|uniref:hypothetical protein n=1 Tax=Kocuria kalidii TaxID=3376283 RepID=UPI00379098AC
MSNREIEPQPLVSVQDARATDAASGHLAWARLVYDDYVIVAGPPDWLTGEVSPEVLLSSVGLFQPHQVERAKISKIELRGVQKRPDLQFTGLRLTRSVNFPVLAPPLEEILSRPLNGEEQLRAIADAVGGPPNCGTSAKIKNLLASTVDYENQCRHPDFEDCCAGEESSLASAPRSIVCEWLGLRGCR